MKKKKIIYASYGSDGRSNLPNELTSVNNFSPSSFLQFRFFEEIFIYIYRRHHNLHQRSQSESIEEVMSQSLFDLFVCA